MSVLSVIVGFTVMMGLLLLISPPGYGKTTLISVGGISTAEEAYRRIKAGASLVQVYSALIFEGPELIKDINTGLIELIKADGYNSITQAIGAAR